MRHDALLAMGLLVSTASGPAFAASEAPVPVVVELYSSEGCSSCPSADVVLDRLDRRSTVGGALVLALELHVDYWNRLGWADPFSDALFSRRQYDYADAFGKDGVYTPQMVIDGHAEFTGSNHKRAEEEIARAAQMPHARVALNRKGDALAIEVSQVPAAALGGESAEVWLAISESDLSTSVPRGENAGRLLRHGPVTRELRLLGSAGASGYRGELMLKIGRGWNRSNLRAVVFVQAVRSRRIVGAAAVRLGS